MTLNVVNFMLSMSHTFSRLCTEPLFDQTFFAGDTAQVESSVDRKLSHII